MLAILPNPVRVNGRDFPRCGGGARKGASDTRVRMLAPAEALADRAGFLVDGDIGVRVDRRAGVTGSSGMRARVKWIEGVGNSAFWFERNQTAMFRKGKLLVTLKFFRDKNANEVDTMQMARILESRLK